MKRTLPAIAASLALLVLAACTSENDDNATEGTPPPGDAFAEVLLDEFTIEIPDTITAGTVSFEITNNGEMEHSFAIEGEGLEADELEQSLAPNESFTYTAELEPGTYTVWCPIGNHRGEGMEATIEVTQAEGGAEGEGEGEGESEGDGGQNLSDEGVGPGESQEELDSDDGY
jgi:plastocyanin